MWGVALRVMKGVGFVRIARWAGPVAIAVRDVVVEVFCSERCQTSVVDVAVCMGSEPPPCGSNCTAMSTHKPTPAEAANDRVNIPVGVRA